MNFNQLNTSLRTAQYACTKNGGYVLAISNKGKNASWFFNSIDALLNHLDSIDHPSYTPTATGQKNFKKYRRIMDGFVSPVSVPTPKAQLKAKVKASNRAKIEIPTLGEKKAATAKLKKVLKGRKAPKTVEISYDLAVKHGLINIS